MDSCGCARKRAPPCGSSAIRPSMARSALAVSSAFSVRNAATGTIIAIRAHRNHTRDFLRVDFDGIGPIGLPRAFFDAHQRAGGRTDVGLDHAYAVTSYAVQGATFAESTSRIDEKASRSETYVDITRGRSANHLYLTRAADPLDGEHLPKAPAP